MSHFTPQQIENYTASLDRQINLLKEHQNLTGNQVVDSNKLLTGLTELKIGLGDNLTKIQWYKLYQSIYENYFFKQNLLEYTNQIKADYIKFWQELGVEEQMDFSKLNEQLYRLPNLGRITTENFENLVGRKFISEVSEWANIYKWDFTQNRVYQPSLGVDCYDYRLSDNESNVFVISVFVYKEYIEIQTVYGFQHNYLSTVIKSMFTGIDIQQKAA